jgi:hypothetical protein
MKVLQEFIKRHCVELVLFSLKNHFAIVQADSSKIAYALTSRMVQQYWVLFLRRHPHQATRSMLLKMNFIDRPEIDFRISYVPPEFFYMSPAIQDPRASQKSFASAKAEDPKYVLALANS